MISAVILFNILIKTEDKVEGYINSVIVWTLLCFTMTESLSVFRAISAVNLWLCWIGIDAVLLVLNLFKYRKFDWKQEFYRLRKIQISKKAIVWGIFAVGMIYLALKTVPYNWDSMTYHLPRVVHWLQNGTVEHYATHNDRQVANPVLGAFINLHVCAMVNGNDFFVNLLQCCSYLTNGILVYHIARKIKCSTKYCVMAAVLFYSMPIAFAEALTTQVDNFSALWMLSFVYLLLNLLKSEEKIAFDRKTLLRVIGLSFCIAFGYMAKPSIGFGMLFFALWLLIVVVRRKDRIVVLATYLVIAGGILTAVVSPEICRNFETYNALSSPGTGQRQLIGTTQKRYVFVNGVKNFTFNMPTVWIYNSSDIIWKYTVRLARALDIELDDPAISEDGREFEVRSPQDYGHDTAVNPVIVWLMIGSFFCLILKNRKKHWTEMKNQYFIIASLAFIFFCVVLRWEPFVSRYMLSYLAVLCPAVSGQMEMLFDGRNDRNRRNEIRFTAIFYFLCISEFVGLMYYHGKIASNQTGDEGYFTNRWEIAESYQILADLVNDEGYRNVGLLMGGDSYEYPLLVMLNDYERIEHVNVENATGKYENQNFVPDIIIAVDYDLPEGMVICHDNVYKATEEIDENICLLDKN